MEMAIGGIISIKMKMEMKKQEERKTYKEYDNHNYNMPPGNPQGLPDESSKNHKIYKDHKANSPSNLRIVSIFPGDLCGRRMLFSLNLFLGGFYENKI